MDKLREWGELGREKIDFVDCIDSINCGDSYKDIYDMAIELATKKPKLYVKSAVEIMQWLVDRNYKIIQYGRKIDHVKYGAWEGNGAFKKWPFTVEMWCMCGKDITLHECTQELMHPDWLEER
jgi:hypothetical protein